MNIPGRRFMDNDKVYTDWMSRGADNVILRGDRVASNPNSSNASSVTIKVFTKNTEDTGDGHAVEQSGSGSALSFVIHSDDTTVQELVVSSIATSDPAHPKGLMEMVRLELEGAAADSDNWIEIRLFPPIFFNAAQ